MIQERINMSMLHTPSVEVSLPHFSAVDTHKHDSRSKTVKRGMETLSVLPALNMSAFPTSEINAIANLGSKTVQRGKPTSSMLSAPSAGLPSEINAACLSLSALVYFSVSM